MEFQAFLYPVLVLITAWACRLPFANFPLDDDFSVYTYRARFARRGFQWKRDLQLIGNPFWKMPLLDRIYGDPEGGVQRLRVLQTVFHMAAAGAVYFLVWSFTHNHPAALTAGILYALYGTSPDLTAGSFNFEQLYIPFILFGLGVLGSGPENVLWAGLFFGLASLAKVTTLIYVPGMMLPTAIAYGTVPALTLGLAAAVPVLISIFADWKLGYLDALSRKQNGTRLATTLRLVRTKLMYFSIVHEVRLIIQQTLPVWIAGVPALVLVILAEGTSWLGAFAGITLAMIIAQRAFSRYHYLPWIALLCAGSGFAMDWVMHSDNLIGLIWGGIFAVALAWNLGYLAPFYLRPTHPDTLLLYEKFDQYLYLPYLGKRLNRLARMRGESGERMYVWGTFSQLYHLTGLPASDNYLHYSIGPWDDPSLEGFFDAVIGGLLKHRPVYLVKTFPDLDIDVLEKVTGLRYRLVKVVLARFPVYQLESMTTIPTDPLSLPFAEKMRIMEELTGDERHAPGVSREGFGVNPIHTNISECRKLVRMNPMEVDGWAYLGDMAASLGRVDEAAECYEKVLALDPLRPETRIGLADQRIRQNRYDEAACLLNEEITMFEYQTEFSYMLGRIYRKRGQHLETANELDRVRTESPERVDCWEWEIEALGHLKDAARLRALHDETDRIEIKTDRDWVRARLATELAAVESDLRPEHETLEELLHGDPENALLHYALASAHERAGNRESAFEAFQEVASKTGNYDHIRANAWFRLARLSPEERREEPLQKCLVLAPDHAGARDLLKKSSQVAASGPQRV
ncbi:hypothetical protein UZ36_01400 [Candidatus Nitromaritima sp. SCGC AAA799-C22]|nr:hypothetical protein UZ36_01400 [Candidatus Nitromaritima sp. SCGC AAA799-C22]